MPKPSTVLNVIFVILIRVVIVFSIIGLLIYGLYLILDFFLN